MLLDLTAIFIGLAILVWGADRFVSGAAALASNLGVAPMLIGLTIVGFGTSAPEIIVSAVSTLDGNPGLAIGNALGSNIANIGLILGVTALIVPLTVHSGVLRREYPVLLAVSLLSFLLMLDGELSQFDGMILLGGLVLLLAWMIHTARTGSASDPMVGEFDAEIPHDMPTKMALLWLALGLMALLISSRMLVWGAVNIATAFGISDLVIGLTIVALGTSLPELAASITSALKGEDDLAIGNVVGSNLYNLLAVLCLPGLLAPGPFDPAALTRDQPMMLGLTVALFALGYSFGKNGRLTRFEGLLLVAAFVGYQLFIFNGLR
ncbi:calcium/sodium antiporter [Candidatus Endoriftia persephonae]|jgi:cation:H+ antiporter|uniref:Calcium/sodium antiporter n=2 Tax=Gammaproteobacteria TaxID=1236 RepID=A0A9J6ZXU6_9GAMM|nr:calcium/sodium antiporter [Candidatus Endoriftia persephone]EGW54623.1 inner membrane protein YrbG, putative calcium/sodium:proton antiporter [endosymbiont of Tevnia jerichonana (vent Tica)]USF87495.1 calcium/sodium antiporter [Candidatus Endoriftia persephone]